MMIQNERENKKEAAPWWLRARSRAVSSPLIGRKNMSKVFCKGGLAFEQEKS